MIIVDEQVTRNLLLVAAIASVPSKRNDAKLSERNVCRNFCNVTARDSFWEYNINYANANERCFILSRLELNLIIIT